MRIALIADPLDSLKPAMDTTLLIAAEAHARGHEVRYADFHELIRTQDGAAARFDRLQYTTDRAADWMDTASDPQMEALDAFDIVVMRQDPPVNERYNAITFLLDGTETPVINEPSSVRDFNEKIAVLDLPDLSPPSLVASSVYRLLDFWRESEVGLILKPLNEYSGHGIVKLDAHADETAVINQIEEATQAGEKFIIAQHFVPEVAEGDKRFFLIDGEVIGRMNRIPAKGEFRANIHAGARPAAFEPSSRDEEIIEGVADLLDDFDLPMVCIDVIGDYLTEINVTSPSGIPEINQIYGDGHEKHLVDLLERRAD